MLLLQLLPGLTAFSQGIPVIVCAFDLVGPASTPPIVGTSLGGVLCLLSLLFGTDRGIRRCFVVADGGVERIFRLLQIRIVRDVVLRLLFGSVQLLDRCIHRALVIQRVLRVTGGCAEHQRHRSREQDRQEMPSQATQQRPRQRTTHAQPPTRLDSHRNRRQSSVPPLKTSKIKAISPPQSFHLRVGPKTS